MSARTITASMLFNELDFTASRSSGPGGQNVNKVNSKIGVKFDVVHSQILSEDGKGNYSQKFSWSSYEGRHFNDLLSRQAIAA